MERGKTPTQAQQAAMREGVGLQEEKAARRKDATRTNTAQRQKHEKYGRRSRGGVGLQEEKLDTNVKHIPHNGRSMKYDREEVNEALTAQRQKYEYDRGGSAGLQEEKNATRTKTLSAQGQI